MSIIKVEINQEKNLISVYNNGKGIPIVIHKEHKIYVPELIFGNLLTSSNYDDSILKITGGRNGYGAKLTNIFSKKFTVETVDSKNKKKYSQIFTKNMSEKKPPEITNLTSSDTDKDYTKITFEPDLSKFKMKELEDDIINLMKKRVYDVAGTSPTHISVFLNNKKIQIKNFKEYTEYYLKNEFFAEKVEYPKIFENPHNRWEVMVTMADSQFQQVSFVNGICTSKGGTHVNHVADQIIDKISIFISKKQKDMKLKPNQIKQYLWIFVNCYIENPTFDSQTKEFMSLKETSFGSKCELSEKFLTSVTKSAIVQNIIENAKAKEKVKLHKVLSSNIKKSSRLLGITKLEDANNAGGKNFESCTLIITEGDSAKALAMSGIQVVGRDSFGVYPLKGKFLNVRDAPHNTIINNKEIQDLIKILGLQMGRDYTESIKGLRYGNLMIMADQDYDGSHIKGLIINFIHNFWPSLIKRNDFLKEFITPIVKVTKNNDYTKSLCYYTLKEYRNWYDLNKTSTGWKIKYYKGLGTSTSAEAKEYFKNISKNRIAFKYKDITDDEAIDLAFSKSKAESRKEWLSKLDIENTFIDHSKCEIKYKEFIDSELILFSNADNVRSIPNLMDGLKPSERKILFACFKRNLKNELKVAQLSGYVAEHSLYHHGEASLCSTITSMAQDFVGTNNVNLLLPIGQFGNRYSGSKGAASPRYIYTCLNKITRIVFKEEDDNLLTFIVEEGQKIEPLYYCPVIPMILVNGAEGIGTGWSTTVPEYNPLELAEIIVNKINGEEYENIKPWYKGFKGEISDNGKNGFFISGCIRIVPDEDYVEITELPVQKWTTRDYKSFLEESHIENKETTNKDKEFEVEDIKEYHTENNVFFRVKLTEESYKKISNLSNEDLLKVFKLTTQISTSNMVLFDHNNKIRKYLNINEIIDEFYLVRLGLYSKRREYLLSKLKYQLELNQNKMNFIKMMLSGTVSFLNMSKYDVCLSLREKGYLSNSEMKKKYKNAFKINSTDVVVETELQEVDSGNNHVNSLSDYDYLMNLNIWSLTKDKVGELENGIKELNVEVDFLEKNDEKILWKNDLENFVYEYDV